MVDSEYCSSAGCRLDWNLLATAVIEGTIGRGEGFIVAIGIRDAIKNISLPGVRAYID